MADEGGRPSSNALRRAASLLAQDDELRRKKRVLASLVVHDLRSPLSGAISYVELMKQELDGGGDPKRLAGLLGDTHELLAKALSLVATILDVDELEDGILRVIPSRVTMVELIEQARVNSRSSFDVRQLAWQCDVPAGLEVDVDSSLMIRVIENLIDNSTRYASRGGRVALSCRVEGDNVEITVGNDGPAVPSAEREAIFGRYYQVEARRAAARANRGLGLYFCRLAIEAHGGSIRVEERADLRAIFVVSVPQPPVVPVANEDSRKIRIPTEPPPPSDPPTIPATPRARFGNTVSASVPPIPKPKPSE